MKNNTLLEMHSKLLKDAMNYYKLYFIFKNAAFVFFILYLIMQFFDVNYNILSAILSFLFLYFSMACYKSYSETFIEAKNIISDNLFSIIKNITDDNKNDDMP